ncbi:Crp/Fnr family transcriptional regulator [Paenibacillus luteus]|uniref:Crp/Fnr family transcriptional regulator n=1 Tax=Paenibacillus luteus TaxID=2545753 RepID=UPI001142091D|nr:cyclic nucleotide-binding domain-containing protein [Paenibacillus luteus]
MKEKQDSDKIAHYLQAFQLKSVFSDAIKPSLSLYSFEQGEPVCTQGEPSQYLYVLVKGKIKIYTTSAEGRTLVISFKTPLEVIGDIEYIRSIDIINTVEAVSAVTMIGIPYRELKKHGSDHAPLLQFLLEIITQKFFIKSHSMSFNLMHPVEVRLASYLLSVSFDETDSLFRGHLRVSGLKDVANFIGTSYRHVNRILQKFGTEGLIERNREFIVVKDRSRLSALAGENMYE